MTTSANIYCGPDDVIDILSQPGVSLRVDDAPPSLYGAMAAKAGNKIDFYLSRFYDADDLANSDLVKDWAAVLCAYYLSCRRGNEPPAGVAILYEEAIAEMTEVKKGQNDIPGIPRRRSYAPVMSVMRSTQSPWNRTVVEASQSSAAGGGVTVNYRRHRDAWDKFGLNTAEVLENVL